ncbi:MAG: glycosyltransferase family 1 protein [Desulfobacterales bacterium]|nr:glycosyltransferase family 1 protein [Desulfobacterales bacterium]
MKIALITYPLETNPTGIGVNIQNIARNLIELDRHNTYFLLHFTPNPNSIYNRNEILYRRYKGLPVMFSDSWYLYRNSSMFDIIHRFSPGGFLFKTQSKIVITVNDLFLYKRYPFNKKTRNYLGRYFFRSSLKKAHAVIAISNFTKMEILKTFGLDEGKLHVVHCAPGITPQNPNKAKAVLSSTYRIADSFILMVSTIEPRKNILGMVKAYERLIEHHLIKEHLVIVGKKGWDLENTLAYINNSRHRDRIHLVGFVPTCDLAYFYQQASLFVYPSFMEGFGIPPLEAMQCGCPTLTSNTSSLPEIMLFPEMMFDPENINEITDKCLRILTDAAFRLDNTAKGKENVNRFSWKESAKKLINVYNILL